MTCNSLMNPLFNLWKGGLGVSFASPDHHFLMENYKHLSLCARFALEFILQKYWLMPWKHRLWLWTVTISKKVPLNDWNHKLWRILYMCKLFLQLHHLLSSMQTYICDTIKATVIQCIKIQYQGLFLCYLTFNWFKCPCSEPHDLFSLSECYPISYPTTIIVSWQSATGIRHLF